MTRGELLSAIQTDLGANFYDVNNAVLGALLDDAINSALSITNRRYKVMNSGLIDEDLLADQLNILSPEIKACVKSLYLQRGSEDVASGSVAGQSSTFHNAWEKMRNDLISNGKRVMV